MHRRLKEVITNHKDEVRRKNSFRRRSDKVCSVCVVYRIMRALIRGKTTTVIHKMFGLQQSLKEIFYDGKTNMMVKKIILFNLLANSKQCAFKSDYINLLLLSLLF